MGVMASQITSLTIVYSTVTGVDQRKHKSSASLTFVWGIYRRPVNSPRKWPVTRKMFLFDDVIMSAASIVPLEAPSAGTSVWTAMVIFRSHIQGNLYNIYTLYGLIFLFPRQVVFHYRENQHDFVAAVTSKWVQQNTHIVWQWSFVRIFPRTLITDEIRYIVLRKFCAHLCLLQQCDTDGIIFHQQLRCGTYLIAHSHSNMITHGKS